VSDELDWIEGMMGLHRTVEFLYVVDGYQASLVEHDGATVIATGEGETLREAVQSLRAQLGH
jgi:hypothetical protein